MRHYYLPAILFLLTGFFAKAQTSKKHGDKKIATVYYQDSLHNAYELARELANFRSEGFKTEMGESERQERSRKLLGRILWYANVQDSSGSLNSILLTKTSQKYALLHDIADTLLHKTTPLEELFDNVSGKISMLEGSTLKDIPAPLRQELLDYLKAYQTAVSELNRSRRDYTRSILISMTLGQPTPAQPVPFATPQQNAELMIQQREEAVAALQDSIISFADRKFTALLPLFKGSKCDLLSVPGKSVTEKILEAGQSGTSVQVSYNLSTSEANNGTSFSIPTISSTQLIDGLAIYLARRVKQESVMWFFETISANAKRFDMIRTFFPATLKMLEGREDYEIPNMGTPWHYALSKDFIGLPRNVFTSEWLKKRYPWATEKYSDFVNGACSVGELLMEQRAYPEIISTLYLANKQQMPGVTIGNDSTVRFADIINLLYAINAELTSYDTATKKWSLISYEQYRDMTKDELEIMLSLLDMRYEGALSKFIRGWHNRPLSFNTEVTPERMRLFLGKIEAGARSIETTRATFLAATKKAKEEGNAETVVYSTFDIWTSVNSLFSTFNTSVFSTPVFSAGLQHSQAAMHFSSQLFDVYNMISRKNYAGAVQGTIRMIDSMFYSGENKTYRLGLVALRNINTTFGKTNTLNYIYDNLRKGKDISKLTREFNFNFNGNDSIFFEKNSPMAAVIFARDRHGVQVITKLAGFLNDAALAKDSKEISKVVESYALPTGSYKRKRDAWHSFDINAFVGLYGGYEFVPDAANAAANTEAWVYGLSAPIGLSYSWAGLRKFRETRVGPEYIADPGKLKVSRNHLHLRAGSTFTATISLIDIGAVLSYRLSHNDSTLPQELKWEQIISPGLHLGWGIPRTPIVLQGGFQYTPLLRRVALHDATKDAPQYNAYRFYIGAFYDLPLINLHERKSWIK